MDVQYGMTGSFVFQAAVEFLKQKKSVSKEEFLKMDEASRAKAFMVSGYTKAEVLDSFLQALTEAVELGSTKEEFQKKMNAFLEEKGYEGVNPFKADVIFRTNLQTAYNAGHYKRCMVSAEWFPVQVQCGFAERTAGKRTWSDSGNKAAKESRPGNRRDPGKQTGQRFCNESCKTGMGTRPYGAEYTGKKGV